MTIIGGRKEKKLRGNRSSAKSRRKHINKIKLFRDTKKIYKSRLEIIAAMHIARNITGINADHRKHGCDQF